MIQILPRAPNVGTEFARGIAKGLSDTIPAEIENARLKRELATLEQQAPNLNPQQYFSRALGVKGLIDRPQVVESLGQLARQSSMNNALQNRGMSGPQGHQGPQGQENQGYAPNSVSEGLVALQNRNNNPNLNQQNESKLDSTLTTRDPLEATLKPYIPPTYDQILDKAGELSRNNPKLYPDPQSAINGANQYFQQQEAQNKGLQGKRLNERSVQETLDNEIGKRASKANVKIPDNVQNKVRNDTIDLINKKGYTEDEAAGEAYKQMDKISREYDALGALNNWIFPTANANDSRRAIEVARKQFKERGDEENFADTLITTNHISPSKAYYLALPVKDNEKLNQEINKIPIIRKTKTEDPVFETKKLVSDLAKNLGNESSVLAVAEELRMKGYDPDTWLDYVADNYKTLNLSGRQQRELLKARNWFPTLNDFWLFRGAKMDKLVE